MGGARAIRSDREQSAEPLVKRFLERCDDYQGVPVFYEASKQWLHVYADFGLTFAKLGEEARVFLPHFALEGSGHKKLRTTMHRIAEGTAALPHPRSAGGDASLLTELRPCRTPGWPGRPRPKRVSRSASSTSRTWRDSPWRSSKPEGRIQAFATSGPTREA